MRTPSNPGKEIAIRLIDPRDGGTLNRRVYHDGLKDTDRDRAQCIATLKEFKVGWEGTGEFSGLEIREGDQ